MTKKINKKQWSWYRIINVVVLCILILLTCIFTVLFIINQEKYTVAFLITILFLGVWVISYFMGHFFFMNVNCTMKCSALFDFIIIPIK